MTHPDITNGPFLVTADRQRMDLDAVHAFLTRSFWATGIAREVVARSIAHSLCFGLFDRQAQVGFARVVTDSSTYAYLCDVYVLEEYRGRGLGKWMMAFVMNHPELQGLRRFMLATADAHGLYAQFGFKAVARPQNMMEIRDPDPYRAGRLA